MPWLRLLPIALLLALVSARPLLAQYNYRVTTNAPRSGISNSTGITFGVDIRNIPEDQLSELSTSGLGDFVRENLELYIDEEAIGDRESQIQWKGLPSDDEDSDFLDNFTVQLVGSIQVNVDENDDDGDKRVLSVRIRVTTDNERENGSLQEMVNSGDGLKMRIRYNVETDDDDVEIAEILIPKSIYVVNDAPDNFEVTGTFRTLIAQWSTATSVQFNNNEADEPSGITVFAVAVETIEESGNEIEISATQYREDATTEVQGDTQCLLTYDSEAGTCTLGTECGSDDESTENIIEGAYIDVTAFENKSGHFIVQTGPSGPVSISDGTIELGSRYAVFARYEPAAIQNSECLVATPTRNFTLSELNGGPGAAPGDAHCFIATVAFGDWYHRHVRILRWFRDNYLWPYSAGKNLIKAYYIYGPYAANLVMERPWLKQLIRTVLTPVAWTLHALKANPYLVFTLVGLAFVLLCYLILGLFTSSLLLGRDSICKLWVGKANST